MFKRIIGCLTCAAIAQTGAAQGQARAAADSAAAPAGQRIARAGAATAADGPADFFTGAVRVAPVFPAAGGPAASVGAVSFEPGARSAWHTHPAGQYLLVTAGVGLTQAWGARVEDIRAGDVVWCPPGVKHWHGAAPGSAMTHFAITGTVDGQSVNWMEKVSDEQYAAR